MPQSVDNPRFALLINGNPIAIGGIETFGVVSASLGYVSRDPAQYEDSLHDNSTLTKDEYLDKRAWVSLTGLDLTTGNHVEWNWSDLQVGDEVTFRILPPGQFDEPDDSGFQTD